MTTHETAPDPMRGAGGVKPLDSAALDAAVIGYDEKRCALNIVWHGGSCHPMSDVNRDSIKPMIGEAIRRYLALVPPTTAALLDGVPRYRFSAGVKHPDLTATLLIFEEADGPYILHSDAARIVAAVEARAEKAERELAELKLMLSVPTTEMLNAFQAAFLGQINARHRESRKGARAKKLESAEQAGCRALLRAALTQTGGHADGE